MAGWWLAVKEGRAAYLQINGLGSGLALWHGEESMRYIPNMRCAKERRIVAVLGRRPSIFHLEEIKFSSSVHIRERPVSRV